MTHFFFFFSVKKVEKHLVPSSGTDQPRTKHFSFIPLATYKRNCPEKVQKFFHLIFKIIWIFNSSVSLLTFLPLGFSFWQVQNSGQNL